MKKITALLFTVLIIFGAAGCSILNDEASLSPTVSGFKYQTAADETATITWEAYDGAAYYTVQRGTGLESADLYTTSFEASIGRAAADGNGTVDYIFIVRAYDDLGDLLATSAEVTYTSYEYYGKWTQEDGSLGETYNAQFWSGQQNQQTTWDSSGSPMVQTDGYRGNYVDDGDYSVTVTTSDEFAAGAWGAAIDIPIYGYTYTGTTLPDSSSVTLEITETTMNLLSAAGGETKTITMTKQ